MSDVQTVLPAALIPGSTFSGSYSFDSEGQPASESNNLKSYHFGPEESDFTARFGDLEVQAPDSQPLIITVADSGGLTCAAPCDEYRVGVSLPSFDGLAARALQLTFVDSTGQSLFDSALLPIPPDLATWSGDLVFAGSPVLEVDFLVVGQITSIVLVPEPSSGSLLLSGAVVLWGLWSSGRLTRR